MTLPSHALAEAIIRILDHRERYVRPRADIEALYSTPHTAELYEQLFEELIAEKQHRTAPHKILTLPELTQAEGH